MSTPWVSSTAPWSENSKRVQNVKLAVINGCVSGNRLLYQLGWGKCRGWTGHVLFVHESVLAPSAPGHAEPHQQCALAPVTVRYRGGPSGQGLSPLPSASCAGLKFSGMAFKAFAAVSDLA